MGEIFEWITHQFVAQYGTEVLPAPSREVGKIWGGDYDIDIATTLLDNSVVFGECKWWDSEVGANVLRELREDTEKTTYGSGAASAHHLIVSKSGFTDELFEQASQAQSLHLISVEELLGQRT